jgi:hypothetical protein
MPKQQPSGETRRLMIRLTQSTTAKGSGCKEAGRSIREKANAIRSAKPSEMRRSPTIQHSAKSMSRSAVERCPRWSECTSRNALAASRPSARSINRNSRSAFNFEE